jgi:cytochrome c-type biogenesis protein CcmH/NrfF
MAPHWLELVSWIALGIAFASALANVVDESLLGHRQQMAVMNVVHPVTALYLGPVWLWAYARRGRAASSVSIRREARRRSAADADPGELRRAASSTAPEDVRPWHVASAVSHCGAGCTLGDIGGEWILFALGAPALGAAGTYGWEVIADFVLAWSLGIVFQYLTIVPMREGIGRLEGIVQAAKVDTLSILSFQVGLFGWMALAHFVLFQPALAIDTSTHWFMMQVGMAVGFLTAWPVNRLLVRRGIKEKMDHRRHLATALEQQPEPTSPEHAFSRRG